MTAGNTSMETDQALEVIPLGGLGEFGMHMMAFRLNGSIIVVDAGIMFPDEELLGVDIIVPDITYLLENKHEVQGIFLTHGHEDHIGALPFILPYLNVPVYGSTFTMALVKNKLEQHGLLSDTQLHTVKEKDKVTLGCFTVEFFHVTHSIVDSFALAIRTPAGTIIHTGVQTPERIANRARQELTPVSPAGSRRFFEARTCVSTVSRQLALTSRMYESARARVGAALALSNLR